MQVRLRLFDSEQGVIALVGSDQALKIKQFEREKDKIGRAEAGVCNATPPFIDQQPDLPIDARGVGRAEAKRRMHILLRSGHCQKQLCDVGFERLHLMKIDRCSAGLRDLVSDFFESILVDPDECIFDEGAKRGTTPSSKIALSIPKGLQ